MNATSKIQQYVQKVPKGKPFTTASLIRYGTRASVDQALSRLAQSGKITRLTRGVYVRPEENRFIGQVLPEPFKVVEAIAKQTNEHVQVNGAEAARQLGLSTQVSAKPLFLTTGQSRCFHIGSLEVTLKHVSRKKIPLSKSKVGLAICALWYLGKDQVNLHTIDRIEKALTHEEFKKFTTSIEYMPAWMSSVVLKYQKGKEYD